MLLERVLAMFRSCTTDLPLFPPTDLYQEGWLLRLVLDWFSRHDAPNHPLSFSENARWFSEGYLPSAFLARYRGDRLAESWTHADGVIGHFEIGSGGKVDLSLLPDSTHLMVIEAKMFAGLAPGVKNAPCFDQAARSVACVAEVLRRADRSPESMTRPGFCMLAPRPQIERRVFNKKTDPSSIRAKVERRVREYGGVKDGWFSDWFGPTIQRIELHALSWEEVIAAIGEQDSAAEEALAGFYEKCIEFNS